VLFAEYAREPSFVERFRREAQSAAALNHPNIVSIYDWGQEKGTYFIVMEYVDGRSLRDMIRSAGPIEPDIAINVASEIASALDEAHRHGVVHRDIKPGNVLVTPNGVVKVGDFGIARAGTSDALTQTGSVMGTATYFSPEQAQGLPVDARSDVYSLGVVLYEMLTGVPPFTGDSPVAVAYKHVREEPVMPSRRNPAIPPDLERVVATAMAKDPNQRYQSASDLRDDLERVRRGRSPMAAPVTALVAPIAADATALQPQVERHPGAEYAAPRGNIGRTIAAILTVLALAGAIALILYLTKRSPSTDAHQVAPPNVVQLTEAQARTQLQKQGFKVGTVKYQIIDASAAAPGVVWQQNPTAHQLVDKGSSVNLTVAGLSVPDLTGKTVDGDNQARAILTRHGFTVTPATRIGAASDMPAGQVESTSPPANSVTGPTTTITLILSPGPKSIQVPDVSGKSYGDAVAALQQAGFQTFEQVNQPSTSVPKGQVIGTSPAVNSNATKLDPIQIIVSNGPPPVEVPDVKGDDSGAACASISTRGFQCSEKFVTDANNVGLVIDQNPPANTSAQPGSTVTITVGKEPASTTTTAGATTTTAASPPST
ncbi:MAG TPA: Stk1 family PASTA domain-containing Ser/Thr kinase, partial [Acidimicrobiia bacterium]